jgi:hypothetical protein
MEPLETPHHPQGGIYNYFEGATIHNLVINGNMTRSGDEHYYAQPASTAQPKPTPEQLARALEANIGKGRAIDSQRAWLGACLLLGWKYGFPRNLQDCCRQVNQLPVDWTRVEYPCKYDNIRMFGSYKFVKEPVDDWPKLIPRDDERSVFVKCLDVSQELEKSIEQTMLTGVN